MENRDIRFVWICLKIKVVMIILKISYCFVILCYVRVLGHDSALVFIESGRPVASYGSKGSEVHKKTPFRLYHDNNYDNKPNLEAIRIHLSLISWICVQFINNLPIQHYSSLIT